MPSADWFGRFRDVAQSLAAEGEDAARDKLVRLLDVFPANDTMLLSIADSLCVRLGLYPYISSPESGSSADQLAYEYHAPLGLRSDFVFHDEQQRVYEALMDGRSVVLSAPTSFGKSAVVDALVASRRWNHIVLIVPTIALIDETRRRLARFRDTYSLITRARQALGDKNLFIMTQERFAEVGELPEVGLFVIDEFYKLSSRDDGDQRMVLLNVAWQRLRATGAQYYLIGPNVDDLNPDLPEDLRESLTVTRFQTVAVDLEIRSGVEDRLQDLVDVLLPTVERPALIFVSSPGRAVEVGGAISARGVVAQADPLVSALADWLAEFYDPDWGVVALLRKGIGVHSGRVPRSLQRVMVRLFDEGRIDLLLCTTTLIEGVNTSARTVIVFDHRINRRLMDFFTFSNIRGRAGRMFRHFVGHVISYEAPPAEATTSVDIPIESQGDTVSLETLIQVEDEALSPSSQARLDDALDGVVLSRDTLRGNRGISIDAQLDVAGWMLTAPTTDLSRLSWSGSPTWQEGVATLSAAWKLAPAAARSGMTAQRAFGMLSAFRRSGGRVKDVVEAQMQYARSNQTRADVVEDVLAFQKNWLDFVIPSMLRSLSSIEADLSTKMEITPGNYEFLIREAEAHFLPVGVAELEEYGIPEPLGVKLVAQHPGLASAEDPLSVLAGLWGAGQLALLPIEVWLLEDALRGAGLSGRFEQGVYTSD